MKSTTPTSSIMPSAGELQEGFLSLLNQTPEEAKAQRREQKKRELTEPRALKAHYDRDRDMITMELRNGAVHAVPTNLLQGVAGADPSLIAKVQVDSSGMMLHWEELDADLSVEGILTGWYGSPAWMERLQERNLACVIMTPKESGRQGGRSTSPAKIKAVRLNGKRGGRPKKIKELV